MEVKRLNEGMTKQELLAWHQIKKILREDGFPTFADYLENFHLNFYTGDGNNPFVAAISPDTGVIYINPNVKKNDLSLLIRHEIGHDAFRHSKKALEKLKEIGINTPSQLAHELTNIAGDYHISNYLYDSLDKKIAKNINLNGKILSGLVTEMDFPENPEYWTMDFDELWDVFVKNYNPEDLKDQVKDEKVSPEFAEGWNSVVDAWNKGDLTLEDIKEILAQTNDELEEAFEPWKADAWLRGERRENVARMSPENMLAYNNYLDNVAYQALRSNDRVKAMSCVNLMRNIKQAANNRGFTTTAERIGAVINHRVSEISTATQLRNLNQRQEPERTPSSDLFKHIRNESLENNELTEEVEIHDELNPLLWENEELKPEIQDKIEEIVNIFKDILKENEIDLKVKDIYLVGSNVNYNYNESSDLDVHIIADETFDCDKKHLPLLYNAYKTLFNRKYDISFKGVNVEIYVENEKDLSNVSSAIYSLKKGWIKKPNKNDIPEIDQAAVNDGVQKYQTQYEQIQANPSIEAIDKFIDSLYELRINGIKEEGEYALGNLIFKEVRRAGMLDELKDLRAELQSKELSLESLDEDLILITDCNDGFNKLDNCKNQLLNCQDEYTRDALKHMFNDLLHQTRDCLTCEDLDKDINRIKEYKNWFKSVYPEE